MALSANIAELADQVEVAEDSAFQCPLLIRSAMAVDGGCRCRQRDPPDSRQTIPLIRWGSFGDIAWPDQPDALSLVEGGGLSGLVARFDYSGK